MPLTLYINVVSIENILKSWLSFCLDQQLEAASAPELHESRVVKRTLMGPVIRNRGKRKRPTFWARPSNFQINEKN